MLLQFPGRADSPDNKIVIAGFSKIEKKWVEKEFDLDKHKDLLTEFPVMSPHKYLNPEKKISHWEGIAVRSIAKKLGIDLKYGKYTTIVGVDQFATQLRSAEMEKYPIMIALKENGVPLTNARGGAQIIFPNELLRDKPEYRHDSLWCWYVKKIVVGGKGSEFLIHINNDKQLPITGLKNNTPLYLYELTQLSPRGWRIDADPDDKERYGMKIREILQSLKINKYRTIKFTNILNQGLDLENISIPLDHILLVVFSKKNSSLPAYAGGPAIITSSNKDDKFHPIYFINSMSIQTQ